MNAAVGLSTLPERPAARRLLAQLENLCLRLEEAKAELRLGFASDDTRLAIGAAKRIESLGLLMGELCRSHERSSSKPASRSSDASHERRHQ